MLCGPRCCCRRGPAGAQNSPYVLPLQSASLPEVVVVVGVVALRRLSLLLVVARLILHLELIWSIIIMVVLIIVGFHFSVLAWQFLFYLTAGKSDSEGGRHDG